MSGARNLTNEEHLKVKQSFESLRNRCLYVLGKCTGFRISELLSISVSQVYNTDYLKVARKNVKGKSQSREVILNKEAKEAISEYLNSLEFIDVNAPLFVSREGGGLKPLTRFRGHQILKKAFEESNLEGSLSSHSMRKSFAMNVYEKSGRDLILTSKALGHANISTTINYLPVNQSKLNAIILGDDIKVQTKNSYNANLDDLEDVGFHIL